jgi:putative heme degradation protein
MLNTYKIYDQLSVVTDTKNIVLVEQNINGLWDVFVPSADDYIANELDTFDAAEGTAFQWLSQVSA